MQLWPVFLAPLYIDYMVIHAIPDSGGKFRRRFAAEVSGFPSGVSGFLTTTKKGA